MKSSNSALDTAISGTGFYQLHDGDQYTYSRDGAFHVDKDSYLVNSQGLRVQGYGVVDGTVVTQVNDLALDLGPIKQSETSKITLGWRHPPRRCQQSYGGRIGRHAQFWWSGWLSVDSDARQLQRRNAMNALRHFFTG